MQISSYQTIQEALDAINWEFAKRGLVEDGGKFQYLNLPEMIYVFGGFQQHVYSNNDFTSCLLRNQLLDSREKEAIENFAKNWKPTKNVYEKHTLKLIREFLAVFVRETTLSNSFNTLVSDSPPYGSYFRGMDGCILLSSYQKILTDNGEAKIVGLQIWDDSIVVKTKYVQKFCNTYFLGDTQREEHAFFCGSSLGRVTFRLDSYDLEKIASKIVDYCIQAESLLASLELLGNEGMLDRKV